MSVGLSLVSAGAGFAALINAAVPGGQISAVAWAVVATATGGAATAIDCIGDPLSFGCGLGAASLAVGPLVGSFGRLLRAGNGTIHLVRDAVGAGVLPAGLATTIGGLPTLWDE